VGALTFLCRWSRNGVKNGIALVWVMVMSGIIILGVRIPALGERTWLAVILSQMVIVVAPAAQEKERLGTRARRRS
jgi:hypothetical protein